MDFMGSEEEWFSSLRSERTRTNYKRGWNLFKSFTGLDGEQLLEKRKGIGRKRFETEVKMFYDWLQKQMHVNQNTARTYCIPIESFLSYMDEPLKLSDILPQIGMRLETYRPSLADIQLLYKLGDLNLKAWLSLSRDTPARVSDLLRISKEQIRQGEFLLVSQKENVVGKCYISPETQELWERVNEMPKTQKGIYGMLSKWCTISHIHNINPHLLRKWWKTTAVNLNLNEIKIKILTFKSVPKDLLAYYLDKEELREAWQKVIQSLPLENKANGRVTNLEKAIGNLEAENIGFKTRIDGMQKALLTVSKRLEAYDRMLNEALKP